MLDEILLRFSDDPKDAFTIDDALKGISIIGGTGSGKTSGSGRTLAHQYLKSGWGGLVLCAKTDEADLWRQYCKETNRENDLIVFGNNSIHASGEYEGQKMIFNPVDYEMRREGEGAGQTYNISNIFMNMYKLGNRIAGQGEIREERYWDTALKRCLNRIIELIKLSGEDLSYRNMVQLLTTANGANEQEYIVELTYIEEHEDSSRIEKAEMYCIKCLITALANHFGNDEGDYTQEVYDAFMLVKNYFLLERPKVDDKTNAIVSESFLGIAEPFLSGILSKHFSGATNLFPEITFKENKIIVLDFPVKEYLDSGIIAQSIFKLLFQQAIERRNVTEYPTPVFLWADEAQYFINPYDQVFLTTARSSRAATVFLSQNISNYLAVMGSGGDARYRVDSLLGNLTTKIFHANSDAATNKYASVLIGDDIAHTYSESSSSNYMNMNYQQSSSKSERLMPQVKPKEFTMLKSGGKNNNYSVEALVFVTGKEWSSGTNFIKTAFTQNFQNKS